MVFNLFEDVIVENEKYIGVLDALNLVSEKIKYSVSDVAKRLLIDKFQQVACMYKENEFNQIELYCSERNFNGEYVSSADFLKFTIFINGTLNFTETDNYGNEHEHTIHDWSSCYWLKSDFFNFHTITKLNIKESYLETYINKVSEQFLTDYFTAQANEKNKQEMINKAKCISEKFFKEQKEYGYIKEVEITKKNVPKVEPDDYKFFLFKKPLLTFHEASCIMTGYDPQYVEQCQNDTHFKQIFSNYLGAKDYIDSCIDAQMLCYNSMDNRIFAEDFKQFLANDNTFIDGFNDHLKNEVMTQSPKNQDSIIDQLKTENEKLKVELVQKEQRIKELESLSGNKDTNLLSLIFDEEKTEVYAPDLANAIKLWQSLYVENKDTEDKHGNRANHWILKNTPYKDIASVEIKRLREVTSPFESWHVDRKTKFNK